MLTLPLVLACSTVSDPAHRREVPEESAPSQVYDTQVEQIEGADDPSEALFDPTRIHDVYLEMDAQDWLTVRDSPTSKTWARADLRWGEQDLAEIGLRAFGSGSMRAGKPSLKLSFDRFVDGQELAGLDELKLDNSSQDYGYLNELLATSALRRAGVPASRTGWVRLHVNGEPAGFFVLLESVDDRFVERWFGHDQGALYSMNAHNWGQGLNPMDEPLFWYEPETSFGGDGSELKAAAEALRAMDADQIEALIDTEGFFRESVARSVMGSLDSFSADGNNFYLFVDEGQVRVIPWDCDVDLGVWYTSTALAVDPEQPWLTSPWSYNSQSYAAYTDPVLVWNLQQGRDPGALIEELLAGPLDWATLDAEAVAAVELIRDDVHEDVFGVGSSFEVRAHAVRLFLHSRWSALAGRDVADCEPVDGALQVADLDPQGSVGWGSLMVDGNDWGPGLMIGGEHHCTGLFAHAPSTVTLQLPEGYAELSGGAGMQDWGRAACGDGGVFSVWQGETELWRSGAVLEYEPARSFGPLPVSPGELTLRVEANAGYSCDTSAWVDLELR